MGEHSGLAVSSNVGQDCITGESQFPPVSSSSVIGGSYHGARDPGNLFDHNYSYEIWEGDQLGSDWAAVDLGSDEYLTKIIFHPEPGWYHWERMPRSFTISVGNSLNGPWTETYSGNLPTPNEGLSGSSDPTFDDLGTSTYGRYIRFDFSQPMCYGSPVDGCTHSHGQVTLSEIAMYTGETDVVDCNGNCGGNAQIDECGVCDGNNSSC